MKGILESSQAHSFLKINFYWHIVGLQCCVSPCIQQKESATYTHIFPPFWASFLLRSFMCTLSPSVVSESLQPYRRWPTRLLCPWDFPRQEYWSWLLFPLPEDLPDPGIELTSPESSCISRWTLYHRTSWEALSRSPQCSE